MISDQSMQLIAQYNDVPSVLLATSNIYLEESLSLW